MISRADAVRSSASDDDDDDVGTCGLASATGVLFGVSVGAIGLNAEGVLALTPNIEVAERVLLPLLDAVTIFDASVFALALLKSNLVSAIVPGA